MKPINSGRTTPPTTTTPTTTTTMSSPPTNGEILGEEKLSSPSLPLPSASSPLLVPRPAAPKNTPSGRSLDGKDSSLLLSSQHKNPQPNDLAAALDQLTVSTGTTEVEGDTAAFGLTALGELTPEVETLLQHHETTMRTLEEAYVQERIALEVKYNGTRKQAREERARVVNGTATTTTATTTTTTTTTDAQGVPEFWSKCIQNHPQLSTILGEQDEAALAHLTDIRVTHPTNNYNAGFALEFHFSDNIYFTNSVLSKTYHMESMVLNLAEEPELLRTESTDIDWKEGMNLGLKKETKRVRRKGKSGKKNSKTVVNMVETPTLFSIFDTLPSMQDAENEKQFEDIEKLVMMDFEVALLFMNHIVPNAIMWYTGEAGDSDYNPEEAMYGESGSEEDEDEGNFENPFGDGSGGSGNLNQPAKNAQEDCKTQ